MNASEEHRNLPLVGSIQNSVAMGFLGNQAAFSVCNALGARLVHAVSSFASGHGGVAGRSSAHSDPDRFRRDVEFLVRQRPGIIHVGYLPKPVHVDIVATSLREYKGVVVLDPVIGDYQKGLYVSEETARAIRDWLVPLAQIVTPNRFEAEVLLGGGDRTMSAHAYVNALFDLGPETVIITSFEREPEKRRSASLFTNGYAYCRIWGPYHPGPLVFGAGDVFAAGVTALIATGASPFGATLLASALASRSVANATSYGGACVDPVAALSTWMPIGSHADDMMATRFAQRSGVEAEPIRPEQADGARLTAAPPKHSIIYG